MQNKIHPAGRGRSVDVPGHELRQATATIYLCSCGKAYLDIYDHRDAQCRHSSHIKECLRVYREQSMQGNPWE